MAREGSASGRTALVSLRVLWCCMQVLSGDLGGTLDGAYNWCRKYQNCGYPDSVYLAILCPHHFVDSPGDPVASADFTSTGHEQTPAYTIQTGEWWYKFHMSRAGTVCLCPDTRAVLTAAPPQSLVLVLLLPKSSCVPATVSLVCLHSRHKAESAASPNSSSPNLAPNALTSKNVCYGMLHELHPFISSAW